MGLEFKIPWYVWPLIWAMIFWYWITTPFRRLFGGKD